MRTKKVYKGIVIKVTSQHIVLMCEGGVFKNVPRTSAEIPGIGQPYVYKEKGGFSFSGLHYLAMVSILFLSVIGFTIFSSSTEEQSYVVAIDINPSIEIYADDNLSIVGIKALNQDGQLIVESIDPETKELDQVVTEIVDQSVNQNYLKKTEKGAVAITVIPLKEDAHSLENIIQHVVQASLQAKGVQAEIQVVTETKRTLEKAKEINLSINKYRLYEGLKSKGIEVDLDVLRGQSIVQINRLEGPSSEQMTEKETDRAEGKSPQAIDQTNPNLNQKETSKKASDKTNKSKAKTENQNKSDEAKDPQQTKRKEDKNKEKVSDKKETEKEEESDEPEPDHDSEQEEKEEDESDEDSEKEELDHDEDSEKDEPEHDANSEKAEPEHIENDVVNEEAESKEQ
jgi:hypothetical protein